jgi:hypothetical protein
MARFCVRIGVFVRSQSHAKTPMREYAIDFLTFAYSRIGVFA